MRHGRVHLRDDLLAVNKYQMGFDSCSSPLPLKRISRIESGQCFEKFGRSLEAVRKSRGTANIHIFPHFQNWMYLESPQPSIKSIALSYRFRQFLCPPPLLTLNKRPGFSSGGSLPTETTAPLCPIRKRWKTFLLARPPNTFLDSGFMWLW